MSLTIFLSGCEVDLDKYYRTKAFTNNIELDVVMIDMQVKEINNIERYTTILYQETYKTDTEYHEFKIKSVYAHCKLDKCEIIEVK